MARRIIGQEHFDLGDSGPVNGLNDLDRLVHWASRDALMGLVPAVLRLLAN